MNLNERVGEVLRGWEVYVNKARAGAFSNYKPEYETYKALMDTLVDDFDAEYGMAESDDEFQDQIRIWLLYFRNWRQCKTAEEKSERYTSYRSECVSRANAAGNQFRTVNDKLVAAYKQSEAPQYSSPDWLT